MTQAAPTPERPRGPAARALRRTAGALAALPAALALAVLVEWAGLTFLWPEEGAARSRAVLREDLARLHGAPVEPLALPVVTVPPPAELAAAFSGGLYRAVFVRTGLEALAGRAARASARQAVYLEAALNAVQTFLVRLAVTVTALPLFLVFAWWGMMEGLVRRDLRRFGGDIERGMVYHWAKHFAGTVVAVPVFVYLAWPGSIDPALVFVPFALAFGVNILVVSATFTKHV